MLLLGDAREVDEGPTVAWVDGESGLQHVFGLLELAGVQQGLALALKLDRARADLVVGLLADHWRRERNADEADDQYARQNSHQILHFKPCRLARTTEPRDEKPVGAVMPGSEQPAGTIRTPRGERRFLHLPC
jgi:hypothetical protein